MFLYPSEINNFMEYEHIYYTYVFCINLSLPVWLSSTITVSKNKKWISNFLIPIQSTLFFYLGISIIIMYRDWRYFPLMLVSLTKPLNGKWRPGFLFKTAIRCIEMLYFDQGRLWSFKFWYIKKRWWMLTSINLLYRALHTFSVLKILLW